MKKEGGIIFQDIEKKYNLGGCKKTEYFKRMLKEFAKFDKKLVKIENYEKMEKEGKSLNEEMRDLISRKQAFQKHIETLKIAMDIYQQSLAVEDEPLASVPPTDFQKDIKGEVETQIKGYKENVVKKLSYFFAFGRALAEKNNLTTNPLAGMSEETRKLISEMYQAFISLPRGEETSLTEEAKKTASGLRQLLKTNDLSSFIGEIAGENDLTQMKFSLINPRENEYGTAQPVSILRDEPQERVPEPVPEDIPEPKEEPIVEAAKPIKESYPEPEPEPEPQREEPHDSWANKVSDEDEPQEEPQNVEGEDEFVFPKKVVEEEEFETVLSKDEARKAKEEEEKARGGKRGRFAGRRPRGNKEDGRGRGQGQGRRPEEHKRGEGYRKEGEYRKKEGYKKPEEADWGEQGGTYKGGYKGNYQPRRKGYYRARGGGYGERENYGGGRRYQHPRQNYQFE